MSIQYELDIIIDATAVLSIVQANQAITIVKVVTSFVMTGEPMTTQGYLPVAWLEFQPLETNTVTWTRAYEVFASTGGVMVGQTIRQLSSTQAQPGWVYTFQNNTFTGAQGDGDPAAYNVANAQGSTFNFGLSQQAVVNAGTPVDAPLNAIPVLNNQQATFSPAETAYIFLSTYLGNGVVISAVPDRALAVMLTTQTPAANIGYNDTTNTFYLDG